MRNSLSVSGNVVIHIGIIFLLCVAGCASTVHKEIFSKDVSYKQKTFSTVKGTVYTAVINSILELSFVIDKENEPDAFVLAKRYFHRGKKNIVIALQAKIVSLPDNKCIVYLNAFETTEKVFIADRTRFFMFIIPLPGGGGKEASQVKIGEQCIDTKDFYDRVFSTIETHLSRLEQQKNANAEPAKTGPTAIPAQNTITPEPAAVPDAGQRPADGT